MLPTALIHEIDRLLKEGELSRRKIALRLGVSRGTVAAIASGRRGVYGKDPVGRHSAPLRKSPPTRCPQCGYRVYLPCRICRMREHQQSRLLLQLLARTDERLDGHDCPSYTRKAET